MLPREFGGVLYLAPANRTWDGCVVGMCHYFQLIYAHDTSRVIQCLMKYGLQEHKNALFEELKGKRNSYWSTGNTLSLRLRVVKKLGFVTFLVDLHDSNYI